MAQKQKKAKATNGIDLLRVQRAIVRRSANSNHRRNRSDEIGQAALLSAVTNTAQLSQMESALERSRWVYLIKYRTSFSRWNTGQTCPGLWRTGRRHIN